MANTVGKVISVAKAEVGYLEKKSNAQLDSKTANAGQNNYTKYWRDMAPGMQGQSWCNCFLNDCFVKAYGVTEAKKLLCTTGDWSYYTPTSASYFKAKNQWHTSNPKIGDVIYFKNSVRIHHVGIVYNVDSARVYTIEGNTSGGSSVIPNGGGVCMKQYLLSNKNIAGYGRPNYDAEVVPNPNKIIPILATPIVQKNSRGAQARLLQQDLNYVGGYKLIEDGDFGVKSVAALLDWQKKNGLVADGIYGSTSQKKMKELLS